MTDIYQDFSVKELREKFSYDPETGKLTWNPPHRHRGREAGSVIEANGGYRFICMSKDGKQRQLLAHRIIWAIVNGEFPEQGLVVDHINGDPDDNRISNLRVTTQKSNARNRGRRKPKVNDRYVLTSVNGVKYDKQESCYVVTIGSEEVRTIDFEDAKYARWNWEFDNGFSDRY